MSVLCWHFLFLWYNTFMNKKYFAISDLHGAPWEHIITALLTEGFDPNDENHILVIAGDITDGFGNEFEIIEELMELDRKKRLVAVRGNHDGTPVINRSQWDEDTSLRFLNDKYGTIWNTDTNPNQWMNNKTITIAQQRWIDSLPYQIETENFYLAHGIYIFDKTYDNENHKEYNSLWGSPVLLGQPVSDWWNTEDTCVNLKHKYSNNIDNYVKELDKPLILGHFGYNTLGRYVPDVKNEGNYVHYDNKIFWLDGSYINTRKIFVKVFEFGKGE